MLHSVLSVAADVVLRQRDRLIQRIEGKITKKIYSEIDSKTKFRCFSSLHSPIKNAANKYPCKYPIVSMKLIRLKREMDCTHRMRTVMCRLKRCTDHLYPIVCADPPIFVIIIRWGRRHRCPTATSDDAEIHVVAKYHSTKPTQIPNRIKHILHLVNSSVWLLFKMQMRFDLHGFRRTQK